MYNYLLVMLTLYEGNLKYTLNFILNLLVIKTISICFRDRVYPININKFRITVNMHIKITKKLFNTFVSKNTIYVTKILQNLICITN